MKNKAEFVKKEDIPTVLQKERLSKFKSTKGGEFVKQEESPVLFS